MQNFSDLFHVSTSCHHVLGMMQWLPFFSSAECQQLRTQRRSFVSSCFAHALVVGCSGVMLWPAVAAPPVGLAHRAAPVAA